MCKQGFRNLSVRLGALLVAAVLICNTSLAVAQNTAAPSGGPQEGIQVHGDWTLTVRNPDGTIAAHHQFKNALSTSTGADALLARLLLGTAVTGQWAINLGMSPAGGCGAGPNCLITESTATAGSHSANLTKTIPTTGPDIGRLVLRGSVRFVSLATILVVTTNVDTCAPATSPANCIGAGLPEFTRKLLTQGVQVNPDQLVELKVVISFS